LLKINTLKPAVFSKGLWLLKNFFMPPGPYLLDFVHIIKKVQFPFSLPGLSDKADFSRQL